MTAQFEAELASKTPFERLKIITDLIIKREKALRLAEYYRHKMFISIDMDKMINGLPEVRIWPPNDNTKLKMPITLNFRYIKNNRAIDFSKMTLSYNKN
jgi:hypothetical protein